MRVITGIYKGKKLEYPVGHPELKPTQDRVKEAMFSILAPYMKGSRVLDLFSGTGNLGFESLSRGADAVVFVDINPVYIYKNKHILREEDQKKCRIFKKKAAQFLSQFKSSVDIIFLDPPWSKKEMFEESLKGIFDFDILSPAGLIVCEHPVSIEIPTDVFSVQKSATYGKKKITLLCHQQLKK